MSWHSSRPSIFGIDASATTTAGLCATARRSPSSPSDAVAVEPCRSPHATGADLAGRCRPRMSGSPSGSWRRSAAARRASSAGCAPRRTPASRSAIASPRSFSWSVASPATIFCSFALHVSSRCPAAARSSSTRRRSPFVLALHQTRCPARTARRGARAAGWLRTAWPARRRAARATPRPQRQPARAPAPRPASPSDGAADGQQRQQSGQMPPAPTTSSRDESHPRREEHRICHRGRRGGDGAEGDPFQPGDADQRGGVSRARRIAARTARPRRRRRRRSPPAPPHEPRAFAPIVRTCRTRVSVREFSRGGLVARLGLRHQFEVMVIVALLVCPHVFVTRTQYVYVPWPRFGVT